MKSEVYKGEVDTQDDLLARVLDAVARIKKHEGQLKRKTRDIRKRVAKCIRLTVGFSKIYCEL
jgi:hypothetical protein